MRKLAAEMADLYGVDRDKADLAALFHDYCKDCKAPGNALAHGGQAAETLKNEFGVTDEDVLNAIAWHTTGRAGMSDLEMIIFLADTVEPGRTYKGADRLRSLALTDLHRATLQVLEELVDYLEGQEMDIGVASYEAIDWLKGVNLENTHNIEQARQIAKIIDDKKGINVTVLDISEQSSFADFFVNATATNLRMLSTLSEEIDHRLSKSEVYPRNIEGKASSGWILMDYGDVIVNLFLGEQREVYQIEKIWSDGALVEWETSK